MTQPETSDIRRARAMLVTLAERHGNFTPAIALELAKMLCHIAGGDGRGVYMVAHDPEGDRLGQGTTQGTTQARRGLRDAAGLDEGHPRGRPRQIGRMMCAMWELFERVARADDEQQLLGKTIAGVEIGTWGDDDQFAALILTFTDGSKAWILSRDHEDYASDLYVIACSPSELE